MLTWNNWRNRIISDTNQKLCINKTSTSKFDHMLVSFNPVCLTLKKPLQNLVPAPFPFSDFTRISLCPSAPLHNASDTWNFTWLPNNQILTKLVSVLCYFSLSILTFYSLIIYWSSPTLNWVFFFLLIPAKSKLSILLDNNWPLPGLTLPWCHCTSYLLWRIHHDWLHTPYHPITTL